MMQGKLTVEISRLILTRKLSHAGNRKLKIYGTLNCAAGKRMKAVNRVFFVSKEEATEAGFRPCAHCLKDEYSTWRAQNDFETAT